jgi:NitT/TauT family transport system permease protein
MAAASADVPAPGTTALRLGQMLSAAAFWRDVGTTGRAFAAAWSVSVVSGTALGVLLGRSRRVSAAVEPLLANFHSLPKVVLYPIVLAFFGLGLAPKVAFGVMHALVPITLLTARAIGQIKSVHWRTARTLRLSVQATVWRIVLPAILPEWLGAVRVGASLSLLGVLIGEMFAAKRGLGFAAMGAMGLGDTTGIAAIGLFLAVFAVAINLTLLTVERKTRPGTMSA